ncbi:14408_t:CDS:2, partial [Racocetra persica]
LTKSYDPKITNFDIAREFNDNSKPISDLKILRWMAPEKMEGKSYNTKCEIFSFGMMLWELSFEKYPYSEYDNYNGLDKIKKHVTSGKREKLVFGRAKDQKEKEIQQTLADIIRSEESAKKHVKPGSLPQIFSDKTLDLDEKLSPTEEEEFMKYLTMAADNGFHVALYNLGNIYISGHFNVEINHDLGISKLKLAAAYGNNDAKKLLKKLGY